MVDQQESVTAKLCAFARAWHAVRVREKIFDDDLAFDIMGKEEYDAMFEFVRRGFSAEGEPFSREDAEQIISEYIAPIPLSRIHFTESRLEQYAYQNGRIQYVICGAGSDTFSFRNPNPDIEIFEIDHPDTQRYKRERIRQLEWNVPKNVHFVPVDFERERMTDKLLEAGFDPNRKTFFSILGVTYYLTLDVFAHTLEQIAELSAPESALVFDYPMQGHDYPARVQRLEEITESLGEQMRGGYAYNDVSRALYALGFQIDANLTPEKVQAAYFSGRADRMHAFENVSLISAVYTAGYSFE